MKKLLLLFWKMGKNQFRTAKDGTKIAVVFSSVMGIVIAIFLSIGTAAAAAIVQKEFVAPIFSYAFSLLLAFNILFGVPQVFKHLYGTNDLALLFTLPIKTRTIYWSKFIQGFFGIPSILTLLSCILLTVFGIVTQASISFFLLAYVVSLLITLIGVSISYLLNLILIQIIPVHRAKELMTAMSAIAGMIVYLLFQLPNLLARNQVDANTMSELPPMPKWLPMEWGGRSLAEATTGSFGFILPFLLLILLTGLMLLISSSLVEKGFRTGWVKMNEGNKPRKKRKGTKVKNKVYHPITMIGIKEIRSIQRDIREWITFLPFLFFMFFPIISLFNKEGGFEFIMNNPTISWIIVQGIFLFMFSFLTSGFASSSIAREGYSIHLLRSLPLSGKEIVLGKFWANWLIPILFLTSLELIIGIFLKWNPLFIVFGIAVLAVMSLGIAGIGLWIGSIGAKYNPNNPQNRLETGTSFLLMFLCFSYLFVALIPTALVLVPIDSSIISHEVGAHPEGIFGFFITLLEWKSENQFLLIFLAGSAALLISLGIALLTLFLSAKKIDKGIKINFVSARK